jgi:hypothetical protein
VCEARWGSNAAPLAARSYPPALKSGTFYFAKKRNFLLCVERSCLGRSCLARSCLGVALTKVWRPGVGDERERICQHRVEY